MALAQTYLNVYCPEFWQSISESCTTAWGTRAASTVVYAYGRLVERKLAPDADEALIETMFSTVMCNVADMSACGVANVAWSLAKQGLGFRHALQPL